jgi:murein DD-endopeptidase MepM/ murein hydrolase activator NlpD
MFGRKNDHKIKKSTENQITEHALISHDFVRNLIDNAKNYCKSNTRNIILSGVAFVAIFSVFCFISDTAFAEMSLKNQVVSLEDQTSKTEQEKRNLELKQKALREQLLIIQKEKQNIEQDGNKTQQELDKIKNNKAQQEAELLNELDKLEDYINENYNPKISKTVASRGASAATLKTDPFLDKVESFYTKVVTYKGANETTEDLRIAIDSAKVQYIRYMNQLPDLRPLKGIRITAGYGYRRDPFTGSREFHSGMDLGAPSGTPIYSAGSGEVVFASYHRGGFGNLVVISHGNGIKTYYAHCSKIFVKVGDIVGKGDKISAVGSTGRSTGPHLHFEVELNGKTVDPRGYVKF